MTTWMLFDYGEVISRPQPAEAASAMAALAGQDPLKFSDGYWRHRLPYDLGQPTHEYWSGVLGRSLGPDDPLVSQLTAIDVAGWSHLDQSMLKIIEDSPSSLALLSNAPEPMAAAIDHAPWAAPFAHLFFSCRLGLAKPDPAIFKEVLQRLDASPGDVTFIDDRAENLRAASALGINAIHPRDAHTLVRSEYEHEGTDHGHD